MAHEAGQAEVEQSIAAVTARLEASRLEAEVHVRRVSDARAEQSALAGRACSQASIELGG